MLERVFVCLLAGGHLLIEGVPGLAKTLTIKTVADVLGGTFQRVQFTPDLVPSDLVGTRMYRGRDGFDTELGPVFCNFLLADEINRAPAKVQSALLEVMQERQVTIGKETHAVPSPFLVMATQNPIESEGTYPLPEAQVDRFMLKVARRLPGAGRRADGHRARARRAGRGRAAALGRRAGRAPGGDAADLRRPRGLALRALARAGHAAARPRRGSRSSPPYVDFGASPRGPINLVLGGPGARAPARPPLRAPAGRARARQGRAPPPDRAQLRGARRRRRRRQRPRPRARDDRDAAARPRARTPHEHGCTSSDRNARLAARAPGRCRRRCCARST